MNNTPTETLLKQSTPVDMRATTPALILRHRIACRLSVAVGCALGILGLSKLAMVMLYTTQLSGPNAFLSPFPDWLVVYASGLVEVGVMIQMLRNRSAPRTAALWLMWLCSLIGVYRFGMWLFSPGSSCHCLGLIGLMVQSAIQHESRIAFGVWLALTAAGVIILGLDRGFGLASAVAPLQSLPQWLIIFPLIVLGSAQTLGSVLLSGQLSEDCFSLKEALTGPGQDAFRIIRDGDHWQLFTELLGSESILITSDAAMTLTGISAANTPQRLIRPRANTSDFPEQSGVVNPCNVPNTASDQTLPVSRSLQRYQDFVYAMESARDRTAGVLL